MYRFKGGSLTKDDVLECGGMEYHVDALHFVPELVTVSDVCQKKSGVGILLETLFEEE